jgi:hypothetical protein
MSTTQVILNAVKNCLSGPRLSTYEIASGAITPGAPRALALYAWNARVSAAFLFPLHICEVVIRNAVGDVLEAAYGPKWPWERSFELSLPNPPGGYSARRDLQSAAAKQPSTGKVIPELKFVFWQEMFTHRHDVRLWSTHLKRILPQHNPTYSFVQLRKEIYADLEQIRRLRNRVAHHEPIFKRNLIEDFNRIVHLVEQKSPLVASWMTGNQEAVRLISEQPLFRGGSLWQPAQEEISALAFQIWCARSKPSGSADRDWVEAERMLGKIARPE